MRIVGSQTLGDLLPLPNGIFHRGMFPSPIATDRVDSPALKFGEDGRHRLRTVMIEIDVGIVKIFDIRHHQLIVLAEDAGLLQAGSCPVDQLLYRLVFRRLVRHLYIHRTATRAAQ